MQMPSLKHKHCRCLTAGVLFALVLLLLSITGCSNQTAREIENLSGEYPRSELLVTSAWLNHRLDDPNMRIIDARSVSAYEEAHVPGAVSVPVGDITATLDGIPFEYDRQKVQEALNRIGLKPEMTVVVYDDLGMMTSGRFFWTLEYSGHQDVRVLHGGWNAWVAAGLQTSGDVPQIDKREYPLQIDSSKLVNAQEVLERLEDKDLTIVDARSPQEYTGDVKLADRGGHIPGAVNLVWLDVLTGGDSVYTIQDGWQGELRDEDIERLKSPAEIRTLLDELGLDPDQQVITYCQTLWRGSHTYFLLRLMGFESVSGYDGSWVEWGNNPDLPIVTGAQPGTFKPIGLQ